jgi:hypothetical protein
MYQGHMQDGSSIQRHSAGDLYPWVIYAQGADEISYGYINPDDGISTLVGGFEQTLTLVNALARIRSHRIAAAALARS